MDDPNPLVWPQNPLTQGGPTWADAWTYNSNAAQNWLQQQRQASYDQGLADPNTGLPTPQGWQNALQQYTNSLLLGTNSPGITAYHGSPFDFERFDMSKIGNGEGAQAYGHGLYFAQDKRVAEGYRDAFNEYATPTPEAYANGKRVPDEDQAIAMRAMRLGPENYLADHRNAISTMTALNGSLKNRIDNFNANDVVPNINEPWPWSWPDPRQDMVNAQLARLKQHYEDTGKALDSLNGMTPSIEHYTKQQLTTQDTPPSPAKLYEVQLNTSPEHLYNWDAPLLKQPPTVQKAINEVADKHDVVLSPLMDGEDLKELFSNPDAVAALRDKGVHGIQYWDGSSRTRAAGSRNMVMFDENLVNVIRKYGIAGLGIGLGAGNALDQSQ